MQRDSDDADHHKMRRIIDIEKPLHSFPLSAFAIVLRKDWNGQECKQLQYSVKFIQEQKINSCVNRTPYHNITRLQLELISVNIKEKRTHYCNT